MMNEEWIGEVLNELRDKDLERRVCSRNGSGGKIRTGGRMVLNFSSNDYLDLANSPGVVSRSGSCLRRWGAGSAASRLLAGTFPCHEELERRIASYKGFPSALVFGSGYAANVGIVPALAGRGDLVLADRLAHASIIDAAVLSRARLVRFRHNDANHLSDMLREKAGRARCLVVTESVFSMDGDRAPLEDIAELTGRHGAMLMVDEAHATGVFGPLGAGLVREFGIENRVNVCMGTLSKALGGYGGFAACSPAMRRLMINRARSFIFSTGIPPAAVGAALGALDEIESHPERGAELLRRASFFRERLQSAGLNTGGSASQIVPLIVGDNGKVLALSEKLLDHGILAAAIRPPTVPEGTARLRLSVTLAHSIEELARTADVIIECSKAEGIL